MIATVGILTCDEPSVLEWHKAGDIAATINTPNCSWRKSDAAAAAFEDSGDKGVAIVFPHVEVPLVEALSALMCTLKPFTLVAIHLGFNVSSHPCDVVRIFICCHVTFFPNHGVKRRNSSNPLIFCVANENIVLPVNLHGPILTLFLTIRPCPLAKDVFLSNGPQQAQLRGRLTERYPFQFEKPGTV
jgi:hypothetical protein